MVNAFIRFYPGIHVRSIQSCYINKYSILYSASWPQGKSNCVLVSNFRFRIALNGRALILHQEGFRQCFDRRILMYNAADVCSLAVRGHLRTTVVCTVKSSVSLLHQLGMLYNGEVPIYTCVLLLHSAP
jgi:hypothetical protein